jgi:serine/threonine protein kinase/tetratricopeptide (TPR) repeat protein
MIGTTLSHYRIAGKLGHGGMGEVYLAEDTKLKRQVALKILPTDLASDPEALARFQREAEAVAALNHPHIVTIFSVEEDEGTHFLTMELVEGESLGRIIPEAGMDLDQVFELAIPLTDALSTAHAKGIVHRDLKPANVMVTEEGRVKILDFGLAKLLGEASELGISPDASTEALTEAGKVMGTVPYMSPEQVQGRPLDHRSDIFSIGVLLYEMATGSRPFAGDTSADLISSILRDTPDSVTELKVDLPHHLGRIVRHCLEKDPNRRYQSALDIRNELEDLRKEIDSGTIHSETAVLPVAATAQPRGLPKWVIGSAIGLAALAVLLAGWYFLRPESTPSSATAPSSGATATQASAIPSLAVLYFDNLSGDPELDWLRSGLTDMLVTDLSQSPDLRVLSTDRLYQILSDLRKLDERITSFEVVSEVAQQADAARVITGSFAKLGETIRISIKIQDAATGEILEARSVDALAPEDIFARIDDLSLSIRQILEPPERPVVVADRDLTDVSTSSVLAYRHFVEAEKLHYQLREQEAIELYKQAAEEDPNFAMAWAKLATSHGNMGMIAESREFADKAMQHLDRLTEPERAYVEGRYYGQALETYPQAIETYARALELYPHLTGLSNNLGLLYSTLWMLDEAIATFEQGIQYGDTFPGTYHDLAQAYLGKGDPDRAFEILEAHLERFPDSFATYTKIADLRLSLGELAEAEVANQRAEEIQPGWPGTTFNQFQLDVLREDWLAADDKAGRFGAMPFPFAKSAENGLRSLLRLGHGRSAEALALAEASVDSWPGPGAGRAQSRLQIGAIHLLIGDPQTALDHARAARQEDPGTNTDLVGHALEALAQQALGQERRADLLLADLGRRVDALPGSATQLIVNEVQGRLNLDRGEIQGAIAEFEQAEALLPHLDGNGPRIAYILGEAYREGGRSDDAERKFREVTDAWSTRIFQPAEFVRSHYELGRLLEQRGAAAEASDYFQKFLAYWGDGNIDPDKIEYARNFLTGG